MFVSFFDEYVVRKQSLILLRLQWSLSQMTYVFIYLIRHNAAKKNGRAWKECEKGVVRMAGCGARLGGLFDGKIAWKPRNFWSVAARGAVLL
jgi:hypothetical protein